MSIELQAPKQINATLTLPSSKSISNRALIIHALVDGTYPIQNLSKCDDTQVLVRALKLDTDPIDIQAAGTAMRFMTAYLSVLPGTRILTGTLRMQQRPIGVLVDALRQLGARITYVGKEGFPPLRIEGGNLTQSKIELPGDISSQYISALLMIAPSLPQGLQITLNGEIVSRPYIDLTLSVMRHFGAQADWCSPSVLKVEAQPYRSVPFSVESDWSAASYWYEILALAPQGTVTLPGLFKGSHQGDSRVATYFEALGVETVYGEAGVTLKKGKKQVECLEHDLRNEPDLVQTLVVTCCLLGVRFRFTGLQSLKIKETDRLEALTQEMKKLGYVLHQQEGSILSWEGERCEPRNVSIETYQDHRMAMAFAPAALAFPSLQISHPEVVSKSYPSYWSDLETAGFKMNKR